MGFWIFFLKKKNIKKNQQKAKESIKTQKEYSRESHNIISCHQLFYFKKRDTKKSYKKT